MTAAGNGNGHNSSSRRLIEDAVAARKRAQAVKGLRGLAQSRPLHSGGVTESAAASVSPLTVIPPGSAGAADETDEHCELCGLGIAANHRHLLHLVKRSIICSCEACWAMRAGEGDYRPVGNRTLWLPDLDIPDELWASFQIPIGLAFFMNSTVTACVVAMYPSPAGATESELHFESWAQLCELNPILGELEPDVEGLIVNRLTEPATYLIAPIDRCYGLTGTIKMFWEGISGGAGISDAVTQYFDDLRAEAVPA
jgi:hypothetical protein